MVTPTQRYLLGDGAVGVGDESCRVPLSLLGGVHGQLGGRMGSVCAHHRQTEQRAPSAVQRGRYRGVLRVNDRVTAVLQVTGEGGGQAKG